MKNLIKIVLLLVFVVISSCKSTNYPNLNDGIYADIQTDKGSILLQLEYENTPITVASFVSLAEGNNVYVAEKHKGKPFYDGLKFHRVVENFIVQGGDPLGVGTGGPGYQFEDEFPTNDDGNLLLSHNKAGILSMANSGPDTNGSQFFITHRQTMNLDGRHTVFGHVVEGQAIVDSIVKDDVMNTIKIVRVGSEAKKFDARQVFSNYFKKLEEVAKEKLEIKQKAKDDFLKLKDENEAKAEILASGLKIYFIKKGEGEKPNNGNKVNVIYAGYFTTGDLFDSNIKDLNILFNKYDNRRDVGGGYNPVAMDYSPDARLIPGFKEGLKQMKVGDKVMLFIPSHLAYGPQGYGSIPPDTELIFELEIINIVQ